MNRVLDYAARSHGPRGTIYANASVLTAGIVLVIPAAMWLGTSFLQYLFQRPLTAPFSPYRLDALVLDLPAWLTVCLPVAGILLGAAGLALRCKRHQLVALGFLVNIAGLIAAIGAILIVG